MTPPPSLARPLPLPPCQQWTPGDVWTVAVPLPAAAEVEFKFLLVQEGSGVLAWTPPGEKNPKVWRACCLGLHVWAGRLGWALWCSLLQTLLRERPIFWWWLLMSSAGSSLPSGGGDAGIIRPEAAQSCNPPAQPFQPH